MANPYDQFDQGGGVSTAEPSNPYDKFDAPVSPNKANGLIQPNPALQAQWANADPKERIGLLLTHFGPEAVKQAKDAVSAVTDVGAPAAGQTIGRAVGELGGPVTSEVGGTIGGGLGDLVAQEERIREGKQPSLKYGELAGMTLASAVPGGSLADTGTSSMAKQALAQGAGGLASKTLQTEIDEGRLPTGGEAALATVVPAAAGAAGQKLQLANPEIQDAVQAAESKVAQKRAILAAGQKAGLVVEPAMANPSITNKFIESLAGSPSIRQAASHMNAETFDDMAKAVLDPTNPNIELTSAVTRAVRAQAFKDGYEPLANIGKIPTDQAYQDELANITANRAAAAKSFPGIVDDTVEKTIEPLQVKNFDSGDALKAIQVLRDKASSAFDSGQNELGIASRQAANAIEGQIERHLASNVSSAGPTTAKQAAEMLQNFRDARQLMAQSHDVEDAIREGSGSIIPSVLAGKVQNQRPLSGNLKTAGEFANTFPQVSREAGRTPVPGATVTGHFARAGLAGLGGIAGGALGGHEGAEAGALMGFAVPSIRGAVRSLVLSKPYQKMMTNIPAKVEAGEDKTGLLLRTLGQSAGQSPGDEGEK